jgi:CDP-ribitol ribitolphosphotransferase / teichoic acid ribitol-phosphate polymerase
MPAAPQDPSIEVSAIRWERIQWWLEARIPDGLAVDPADIHLANPAQGLVMAPTHADHDGDRLAIRFNVMTGPGRRPLAPGRWTIDIPAMAAAGVTIGSAVDIGRFTTPTGAYTMTPFHDPATRTLGIDVTVEPIRRAVDDRPAVVRLRLGLRMSISRLRRAAFRSVVSVAGRFRRTSRTRILFTSRLISDMSGNIQVVYDRMLERGLDRDLDIVTMLKPGLTERWSFPDRFRLARAIASADVIVLDDSFPPINWVKLRPDVRLIQLWHAAGAFKTVGQSRFGTPDPNVRVHPPYSAAIVSSAFDVPFYAEAFGIPEAQVIPTGIPRMDRFFDEHARAAGLAAARAAYPATNGRLTILFAPTYRGDTIPEATYDFDRLDYAGLHAVCVERDAVVIIKMHPFVRERLAIPAAFRDRLLDGSVAPVDVNDLLFAVDLLITDYSSIVFEYSTLRRPMLFYAYDLDDYASSRDFYVPFESFVPGRIVRTFPELLDAIRREDYQAEKVADFATRHFAHLDSGSTDRVIDQLIVPRVSLAR